MAESVDAENGALSEEEYYRRLTEEVSDLAVRVAECRERGPVEFEASVEASLSAFRDLPQLGSCGSTCPGGEEDKFRELADRKAALVQRLECAVGTLPGLMQDVKDLIGRLDSLLGQLNNT